MRLFEDTTDKSGKSGLYSVVERPDAATVVLTSPSGNMLMLNSFRYPTGRSSLELPMGAVDSGETPELAAGRELEEETGVACEHLARAGWFYALPGLTAQKVYVFKGSVSDAELRRARTVDSEVDLVGTSVVSIDQLGQMVQAGKITDSLTICSLFLSGFSLRP